MAARGDPPGPPGAAAFDAFVLEYQDMVYAVAVRLLANEAEAEDVAQTVFLRAYERFDELKGEATVPGWLKTVTTNLCLTTWSAIAPGGGSSVRWGKQADRRSTSP